MAKPLESTLRALAHAERAALANDLAGLSTEQWHQRTLCARFRTDVHNQRRLQEHLGSTPAETLENFRAVINSSRAPSIEALTPVAEFYASRNFAVASGSNAKGLQLTANDGPFCAGVGAPVTGTTLALVMALAGRAPYLENLEGPGVSILTSRVTATGH